VSVGGPWPWLCDGAVDVGFLVDLVCASLDIWRADLRVSISAL
jgi:hypothetical protein